MSRIGILGVVLLLLAACLASSGPAASPTVKVAFYAPRAYYWADQEDPPVHIVGFENSRSEVRFVLSNSSDKTVASVRVVLLLFLPPGCATKSQYEWLSSSGRRYAGRWEVSVAPHGRAVLSPAAVPPRLVGVERVVHSHGEAVVSPAAVHYPKILIHDAQRWAAPYVQVQLGISRVYFQDGSTWPVPVDAHSDGLQPFDPELVKSASSNCADAANVATALDLVDRNQIVFERESSQASDFDGDHSAIPQLHFSCTLEGPKAVCHMPVEGDRSAQPLQSGLQDK